MAVNAAFWEHEAELLAETMRPWIEEAAANGVAEGGQLIEASMPPGLDWELINNQARAWAVVHTAQVVAELTTTAMNAFVAAFPDWVASSAPLSALVEKLAPIYGSQRAMLIATTETTRAYARGNRVMWGASGVVGGTEWMTGQDSIVCPICRPLSGKKTALDGTYPGGYSEPPAHPGCRCYEQPVVGEMRGAALT